MILYGAMFSCLDPILTIAAGCGFRSPFLTPMEKRDESDAARRKLAGFGPGQTSDHLTLVAAYSGWIEASRKGKQYERDFLNRNFLSIQTLRQISEMRTQYVSLLDQIGFLGIHSGLFSGVDDTEDDINPGKSDDLTSINGVDAAETTTAAKPGGLPKPLGLSATAAPFSLPSPKQKALPTVTKGQGFSNKNQRTQECLRVASVNAGNELLVRACICAGLYPNVATVAGGADESNAKKNGQNGQNGIGKPLTMQTRFANAGKQKILTKGDGEVSLHPTSVVFGCEKFATRFLVFHEKVKTTKVYLRDATLVTPYPLLLFGGKIKVDHERQVATCDGWIRFRASARVAVLFKNLRKELDLVLMAKIAAPGMRVADGAKELVRTIVELLESEHSGQSDTQSSAVTDISRSAGGDASAGHTPDGTDGSTGTETSTGTGTAGPTGTTSTTGSTPSSTSTSNTTTTAGETRRG